MDPIALAALRKTRLMPPEGFSWTDYPAILDRKANEYGGSTTWTPPTPSVTYYVSLSGDNGNSGLTEAAPLRDLRTALGKSDVDRVVFLEGGIYDRNRIQNAACTRSVVIEAPNGRVILSTHEPSASLSWAADGTYPDVYVATRSATYLVLDSLTLDTEGFWSRLISRASVADVNANPGSFFVSGSTVYVRTADSRAPDDDVRVMLSVPNGAFTGDLTTWISNVSFYGGSVTPLEIRTTAASQAPTTYLEGVHAAFANAADNFTLRGLVAVLKECHAHAALADDGFDYKARDGNVCKAVEINCKGTENGWSALGTTQNGSSMHEGGSVVRVGGVYTGNAGPNVADVDAGTESWCVGAVAGYSVSSSTATNVNFAFTEDAWLDNVTSVGSDAHVESASGAVVRIRGGTFLDAVVGTGSVRPY